jgi:hypothetical protein
MQKTYFHDKKHHREKDVQKKIIPLYHVSHKRIVDINKLLNRVRMDEKNETKRKIIFYSLITLALGFFSTLIVTIK